MSDSTQIAPVAHMQESCVNGATEQDLIKDTIELAVPTIQRVETSAQEDTIVVEQLVTSEPPDPAEFIADTDVSPAEIELAISTIQPVETHAQDDSRIMEQAIGSGPGDPVAAPNEDFSALEIPSAPMESALPETPITQGPATYSSEDYEDLPPPPISPLTDHPPPPTSPLSEYNDTNDLKLEPDFEPPMPIPISFQQHPSASSLVSPPASTHTHTDAEHSPPAPDVQNVTPTATSSSSRHSSRAAKSIERYTPESSNTRRNSLNLTRNGSVTPVKGTPVRKARASTTPAKTTPISEMEVGGTSTPIRRTNAFASPVKTTPVSGDKKKASRSAVKNMTGSAERPRTKAQEIEEAHLLADEESLRLIRELQAQDIGLRRRGKV
jgi:hypothetical protein